MPTYLSIDGGGSKCRAVLYDENLATLGSGLSGGVNTTQASFDDVRQNIAACLAQVFSAGAPRSIERAHICFVGPVGELLRQIRAVARVEDACRMPEPVAGLYAGALRAEGILALSGTGSDIFYVTPNASGQDRRTVGGWGPILGDQGSGSWLGQRALRAAVMAMEGWGPDTALKDMLREEWSLTQDFDMVSVVHQNPAPFRKVASVTRLLGKAADAGDAVARDILREGGALLARQTVCLLERAQPPAADRVVTCCGGAWKTHPLLFDSFRARLGDYDPDMPVNKPWFEHVLAGPARLLLDRGLPVSEAKTLLDAAFPDYRIKW